MKSIELFAGIGGIALAAEWAGIETVAFCEREPFCQKILNKHWPDVPIFDDIKTLDKKALEERGIDVGAIELITGGFPCQPYSVAGKRKGTEDDRDLWPEMFRIIEEIRPTWVVGENVANFANMELDRTLFDLESIGYKGRAFVLPAAAVEAPHERMRTFIVSHSNSVRRNDRGNNRQERQIQGERHRNDKKNQPEWFGRLDRAREVRAVFPNTNVERKGENYNQQFTGFCEEHRGRWAVEPDVGRVAHGVSNRVDRIKGLGNAVVPQQIYPIFETIMKIERGEITC
ncbi:site-specific DNA-methyltransferase [Shouchella clausii KSM-K16]|uniref:Cytosine-specific methyltransferase n=1 Tax=Shouchella clausii (strain KSM-K16) TaxID=66692 RepID=Q5WE27_SHOC1|nr:DNA (cytosine-5-)-methyltransferase [Shouchella clausii]BAD65383.1 site-specific DNA-methyltransferase [Shouchella clausii KSM-K16]